MQKKKKKEAVTAPEQRPYGRGGSTLLPFLYSQNHVWPFMSLQGCMCLTNISPVPVAKELFTEQIHPFLICDNFLSRRRFGFSHASR